MRRRVADALDAGDLGHVVEERREIGDLIPCVAHGAAVRVHVLAEERHLHHALVGEVGDLGQHVVERTRDFLAPRVGHDAERAVLAAAFHDRDERRGAFDARRRQVVEFLDLGKAHVDLGPARRAARAMSCGRRCSVCGPNTTSTYGARFTIAGAFLRGDAAADADHEVGVRGLEGAHATQVVEHSLLRLLAHGARVEQDDVRVLGALGERHAIGRAEHVGHAVRVVLVHLASERADVELLGQGANPGAAGKSVGAGRYEGREL